MQRLGRLLPPDTAASEITSATGLASMGVFLAVASPMEMVRFSLGVSVPSWDASVPMVSFGLMHLISVVLGEDYRHVRATMIFAEFSIWSYMAVSAYSLGVYPVHGASSVIYAVLALANAWAFLYRMSATPRGG